MAHAVEGLNDHNRIQAKSWADDLFHSCPMTEKFFDKNTNIADIPTRQQQKINARNNGESLNHAETSKYFERSNVTTITHNLRPVFNIYFQLAFKNGATNVNQALSPAKMREYVKWREEQVYNKEITKDTFNEYMSKMRILANMSTATDGFPTFTVDKMTKQASIRVNDWFDKNKDSDSNLNNKHKVNAYLKDEPEKIIAEVTNEKAKVALEVVLHHGFRIENAETMYLDTRWQKVGKRWQRVQDFGKVAIISKGSQRHTVTIRSDLFAKLKELANEKNVFHVSRRTIEDNAKRAAEKANIEYISVHNFRATQACRLYNQLKETGIYTEEQMKILVSKNLFHGRTDITEYYLKAVLK